MPGSFGGLAAWQILARLVGNSDARPASAAGDRVEHIENEASGRGGRVSGDELPSTSIESARDGTANGSATSTPRKDPKLVEKEDKARFARLKELTRMMGLKRGKGRKA